MPGFTVVCSQLSTWAGRCAGQLVQALGGASDGQAALVSLFSVASAAGRLAAGHLPERALHAWRTPRCACPALALGVIGLQGLLTC